MKTYITPYWISIILLTASLSSATTNNIHATWNSILQANVTNGRVDYQSIKKNQPQLSSYLNTLATTNPENFSRNDKLAYWINAYNAFTVKMIIDNYPVKSIKDIKNPWGQKSWLVGKKLYSLNHIEHKILRKQLNEPRIHFAIVCASIGCPDLQNRAFTGKEIDAQLDHATRNFMQSDKHVRISTKKSFNNKTKKTLHLSKIFSWFTADFTKEGKQTVADFVVKYAKPEIKAAITSAGKKIKIDYLKYDWNLNKK